MPQAPDAVAAPRSRPPDEVDQPRRDRRQQHVRDPFADEEVALPNVVQQGSSEEVARGLTRGFASERECDIHGVPLISRLQVREQRKFPAGQYASNEREFVGSEGGAEATEELARPVPRAAEERASCLLHVRRPQVT